MTDKHMQRELFGQEQPSTYKGKQRHGPHRRRDGQLERTKADNARKERNKARRAAGLCIRCAQPNETVKSHCPRCLEKIGIRYGKIRKTTRERNKVKGVCNECQNPREPGKKFCRACLDKARQIYRQRKTNGFCVLCGVVPPRAKTTTCQTCHKRNLAAAYARNLRYKTDCMNAYGGCVCACCSEKNMEFLSLDHIHGGGNQERKQMRKEGITGSMYRYLKSKGYPPGFQILCMNCNWAKGKFKGCPHQREPFQPFTFIA